MLLPFVYSRRLAISSRLRILSSSGEAREEVRGQGFYASIADIVDGEWDFEQVSAHRPALIGIEITAENAVSSFGLIAASLV